MPQEGQERNPNNLLGFYPGEIPLTEDFDTLGEANSELIEIATKEDKMCMFLIYTTEGEGESKKVKVFRQVFRSIKEKLYWGNIPEDVTYLKSITSEIEPKKDHFYVAGPRGIREIPFTEIDFTEIIYRKSENERGPFVLEKVTAPILATV